MARKAPRSPARRRKLLIVVGLVALMAALAAAWQWTPLHEYANPMDIARQIRSVVDEWWMAPAVAAVYVAASLVMFPNTVLCLAVIMALGPLPGAAYAYGGSMTAALTGYAIGRRGGKQVDKLKVPGVDRVRSELRHGGFMQVLALRLLPIAPFSVTNILSGTARVRLLPFVAATLVGILPYILTFAAFGRQTRRLLSDPKPIDLALMAGIVVVAAIAIWQMRARAMAHAR